MRDARSGWTCTRAMAASGVTPLAKYKLVFLGVRLDPLATRRRSRASSVVRRSRRIR